LVLKNGPRENRQKIGKNRKEKKNGDLAGLGGSAV
jgi:hypothetical protein